jgi:hypothetical protein
MYKLLHIPTGLFVWVVIRRNKTFQFYVGTLDQPRQKVLKHTKWIDFGSKRTVSNWYAGLEDVENLIQFQEESNVSATRANKAEFEIIDVGENYV